MTFEFENESCPRCGSSDYTGDFDAEHWGVAQIVLTIETDCKECRFGNQFSETLT